MEDKRNHHGKQLIASAVIAALLAAYYIGLGIAAWSLQALGLPFPVRILLVLVPLLLAGVTVFVFLQRVREVRSGEEDDLNLY